MIMNEVSPDGGAGGGGSILSANAPSDAPPAAIDPVASPATSISIPENWKEAIAEDLRGDPSLKHINDFQSLVKSYVHSQKMMGKGKVVLPDAKTATEQDWKEFYYQVGLPREVQDYKLDLKKDYEFNEDFIAKVRQTAHEAGILPQQLNKLLNWYGETNKSAIAEMDAEFKKGLEEKVNALKQEWGPSFEDNVRVAQRAARYFANQAKVEDVFSWLDNTGMGNDPVMIKLLAFMGNMVKDDAIAGEEFVPQVRTKDAVQSEINSIMSDKNHPYNNAHHPGHKKAVEDMARMFEELYPAPKAM